MRPDAQRFQRPDASTWIRPDIARFLAPGTNPSEVFPALDRKFNPNQPRIPAGRAGGGRWTDGNEVGVDFSGEAPPAGEPADSNIPADANSALAFQAQSPGDLRSWLKRLDELAWKDPRPIPSAEGADVADNLEEIQGRRPPLSTWFPGASPGQQARLEIATARSGNALAEIRRYDENWEPREQSWSAQPGSIEGAIGRAEARAAEAEAHLNRLRSGIGGNLGPPLEQSPSNRTPQFGLCDGTSWISSYRTINNATDLFGRPVWPNNRGTVAVTRIDGDIYFGVNSKAPGYSDADWNLAAGLRDQVAVEHPELIRGESQGSRPLDAVFHAEANLLIRASRYVGSLVNRSIEVQVDQPVCWSCAQVLPKVGLQLGNPHVTIREPKSGRASVMWQGEWQVWRRK
jgi:hypothetical protein